MNVAITNGLQLMPPAFRAGLGAWSRSDGASGSATWAQAANAGIVPSDQDFGSCLEIIKQESTTRVRFMGETPMIPGVYLRITARLKCVAGAFCSARIAGWAGNGARVHVDGLVEVGPVTPMTAYGEIIEISAVVSVGARQGVDMSWGTAPVFGRFGLDLVGANGGAIRIESLRIDDVTAAFIPQLIDWVDVRDFGAKGDGTTNDRAAFLAADRAANGGSIVVPEGDFFISGDIGINAPIRFKGRLVTPATTRVALLSSFNFPTYADAFKDETVGLRKALQALFGFTDHVALDLCGRRVNLTGPLSVSDYAPGLDSFSSRRVIMNGSISAVAGPEWTKGNWTSTASYNPSNPETLTNVANVGAIEIGSLVSGNGVGREVYVAGKNVSARTLTLSQPLYGGAGTRSYTFERFRYMFDFIDMTKLDRLNFQDIDFDCAGVASGIMLPPSGELMQIGNSYFGRPKDRAITSVGRGCQGMLIDNCHFVSDELELPVAQRRTVAINVNANDLKLRHNRFVRFCHFLVANGGGHTIIGNHWFQGDATNAGIRNAGLVLTLTNIQTTITGNYVDNASIEWTNEHSATPDFQGGEFSFGGLTITGNTFLTMRTAEWFSWLVVKPYGTGHFIHGLSVMGNVFKSLDGTVDRIDRVDSSIADLNYSRMRNVQFEANNFNNINVYVANPLTLQHQQNTADDAWTLPVVEGLPFRSWAQSVASVVAETAITTGSNQRVGLMPWVEMQVGGSRRQLRLNWSQPVKGRVSVMVRMDRPQ